MSDELPTNQESSIQKKTWSRSAVKSLILTLGSIVYLFITLSTPSTSNDLGTLFISAFSGIAVSAVVAIIALIYFIKGCIEVFKHKKRGLSLLIFTAILPLFVILSATGHVNKFLVHLEII